MGQEVGRCPLHLFCACKWFSLLLANYFWYRRAMSVCFPPLASSIMARLEQHVLTEPY